MEKVMSLVIILTDLRMDIEWILPTSGWQILARQYPKAAELPEQSRKPTMLSQMPSKS